MFRTHTCTCTSIVAVSTLLSERSWRKFPCKQPHPPTVLGATQHHIHNSYMILLGPPVEYDGGSSGDEGSEGLDDFSLSPTPLEQQSLDTLEKIERGSHTGTHVYTCTVIYIHMCMYVHTSNILYLCTHVQEGYGTCLGLCLCVCLCVTTLAATSFVYTLNKARYYGLLYTCIGFSWFLTCGFSKKTSVQWLWHEKNNIKIYLLTATEFCRFLTTVDVPAVSQMASK